jgi:hypothetical protein
MLYKKAALTTRQIVILTILIISFVIILFLIFRLNLPGQSEQQICHNSVVQRGSSILSLSDTVPLNCRTHYVCISTTSKCEGEESRMPNPDDIITVKSENELYKALADEMARCWWMYGEGEIDYLGEVDFFEAPYCSICSHIIFHKSVQEDIFPEFDADKLNRYLIDHEVEKDLTYASYFYKQKIPKGANLEFRPEEGTRNTNIDLSKQFYVITSRYSEKSTLGWILSGAAITGIVVATGALYISGVGIPAAIAITAGLIVGGIGGYVGASFIEIEGNKVMTPTLIQIEDFNNFECENIKSLS